MIDFHSHITTPGSRVPRTNGEYHHAVKPRALPDPFLDFMWAETIEMAADKWRGAPALRRYRRMSPVIYQEMLRRLLRATGKRLMLEMARNHVRQACVMAIDPYIPTAEIVDICARTNDILLPFGSVDPWPDDWREHLSQTLKLPISGFKLHCGLQRISYAEPRMIEIFAVLEKASFSGPILLHAGDYPIYQAGPTGDWVADLRTVVSRFSGLSFVCGHCGWNRPGAVCKIARKHQNLWLETSWQPPAVLRRICDLHGPERLLLGSDYPLYSMRRAVRNAKSVLTPREFAIISEDAPRALLSPSLQSRSAVGGGNA